MEKKIAIYLRVSTLGQTTELQRAEIEAYLNARGWKDWCVYEDKLTGTTAQRPALIKLMSDAKSRKVDVVIIWKLDRLFRSLKDLVGILQGCFGLDGQLTGLKDAIDSTTETGRLLTH